jgi:hypothetical protein
VFRSLRPITAGCLLFALFGAACGGDEPAPVATTPTTTVAPTTVAPTTTEPSPAGEPVTFTTGTAHVDITGDENVSVDFQLDTGTSNDYDPEDGEAGLTYRGGDDGVLKMTLTYVDGALDDSFIAIGLGGEFAGDDNYWYDAFHTQCEVTAEPFTGTPTAVRGSFVCDDLEQDSGGTIDATGTFEATA